MNYRSQTIMRTLVYRFQKTAIEMHIYQNVIGKGRTHVGKMDSISTDSERHH